MKAHPGFLSVLALCLAVSPALAAQPASYALGPIDLPARSGYSGAPASADVATLIFTATSLRKGYHGVNLGVGSLHWFDRGGQLARSRRLISTHEVTADKPSVRFVVPAGKWLALASSWSAGGAFCLVDHFNFMPERGAVYRLTNEQDEISGICRLRLENLAANTAARPDPRAARRRQSAASAPRVAGSVRSPDRSVGICE